MEKNTGVDFEAVRYVVRQGRAYRNYLAWMKENSIMTPLSRNEFLTGSVDNEAIVEMWLGLKS